MSMWCWPFPQEFKHSFICFTSVFFFVLEEGHGVFLICVEEYTDIYTCTIYENVVIYVALFFFP